MARYDFIATYMLANKRNGTLYLGVTSDLFTRVVLHREGKEQGFAQRYGCRTLVWFERHAYMRDAIDRPVALRWPNDVVELTIDYLPARKIAGVDDRGRIVIWSTDIDPPKDE